MFSYNSRFIYPFSLLMLFFGIISFSFANTTKLVFVSFSMPEQLLLETLQDSAHLRIPATLNGLYQNSMTETAKKVMALSDQVPNLQLQIDPTAFELYDIHQVPALVVASGDCFDVIYGHLSLMEGLNRINQKGSCGGRT